jgi:hypothetical protein
MSLFHQRIELLLYRLRKLFFGKMLFESLSAENVEFLVLMGFFFFFYRRIDLVELSFIFSFNISVM